MVVIAAAQRGRQALAQAPFVLDEQRPHGLLVALRQQPVLELGIPELAAHGQHMGITQGRHQLAVQHQIGGLEFAIGASTRVALGHRRAGDGAANGLGFGMHQAAFQRAEAQTAGMTDADLIAVETQRIAITGLRTRLGNRIAIAQTAIFVVVPGASLVHIQPDVVIAAGRQRQLGTQAMLAALRRRGVACTGGLCGAWGQHPVGGIAVEGAAAHGQTQQILLDGAVDVEAALVLVAPFAVLRNAGAHADFATPLLADLARDDVDHAAHGVRAIERGHGAANDFDTLDGRHGRHEAGQCGAEAVGRDVARHVLAAPVDQDQRVVAGHATDADVEAAGLAGSAHHINAFHALQGFGQIAEVLGLQLLARHDGDGGRGIFQLLLEAGGRDHHLLHGGLPGLCKSIAGACGGSGQGQ